jgi:hypothetical protein
MYLSEVLSNATLVTQLASTLVLLRRVLQVLLRPQHKLSAKADTFVITALYNTTTSRRAPQA